MNENLDLRYRCPQCGASIIWSLVNSRPGSSSESKCGNNLTSSRIEWKKDSEVCFWTGRAERKKDGSVKLFDSNGYLLRPVLYKK